MLCFVTKLFLAQVEYFLRYSKVQGLWRNGVYSVIIVALRRKEKTKKNSAIINVFSCQIFTIFSVKCADNVR